MPFADYMDMFRHGDVPKAISPFELPGNIVPYGYSDEVPVLILKLYRRDRTSGKVNFVGCIRGVLSPLPCYSFDRYALIFCTPLSCLQSPCLTFKRG